MFSGRNRGKTPHKKRQLRFSDEDDDDDFEKDTFLPQRPARNARAGREAGGADKKSAEQKKPVRARRNRVVFSSSDDASESESDHVQIGTVLVQYRSLCVLNIALDCFCYFLCELRFSRV